jgi:hypothetical protein
MKRFFKRFARVAIAGVVGRFVGPELGSLAGVGAGAALEGAWEVGATAGLVAFDKMFRHFFWKRKKEKKLWP